MCCWSRAYHIQKNICTHERLHLGTGICLYGTDIESTTLAGRDDLDKRDEILCRKRSTNRSWNSCKHDKDEHWPGHASLHLSFIWTVRKNWQGIKNNLLSAGDLSHRLVKTRPVVILQAVLEHSMERSVFSTLLQRRSSGASCGTAPRRTISNFIISSSPLPFSPSLCAIFASIFALNVLGAPADGCCGEVMQKLPTLNSPPAHLRNILFQSDRHWTEIVP